MGGLWVVSPNKNKITNKNRLLFIFLGKMVDISTWHCRIGTFCQKSKKVFHVLKSQGKKVIVTSCYFSCFVVSLDLGLNIFIY